MARFHHFCCCLPLRLGVALIALLGLLGGAAAAVLGWWNVIYMRDHEDTLNYTKEFEIAVYVTAGVYTTFAIVAFLGLLGAMLQKRGLVSVFLSLLIGHFLLSLAVGAYSLYVLFNKESNDIETRCNNGNTEFKDNFGADTLEEICSGSVKFGKAVVAVIYSVGWLFELYTSFLVYSYVQELKGKRYSAVNYVQVKA